MAAFIYLELGQAFSYSYRKPILEKVKIQFPDLDFLDLDAESEEFLVAQAGQLVQLADTCVFYLKSLDPEASLGAGLSLVEILIRRPQPTLVILQGTHNRLERLLSNRATLTFLKNVDEPMLFAHLATFYTTV